MAYEIAILKGMQTKRSNNINLINQEDYYQKYKRIVEPVMMI